MRQPKHILSANDNAPIRTGPMRFTASSVRPPKPSMPSKVIISDFKKNSAISWAAPIAALMMACFTVFFEMSLIDLIWPSALIAGLLAWTAGLADPHSRLRNISTVLLVGAVTVSLFGFLANSGFNLIAVEIALVTSCVALLAGWALRSRPAVMLSSLAALAYLVSLFPQLGVFTGIVDGLSHIGIPLIPVLLLGQAALGHHLKSNAILFVTVTAGYIWIFAAAKDIPFTALAGLCFGIASAQYCLAKAWAVTGTFGSRLHISFAALLTLVGAYYIQSQWMNVNPDQLQPVWSPNMLWWTAFAGAMLVLFVSSLMRYKASSISLVGIFVISLAALALPLATAKPDFVHMAFEYIPGLNADPGLGLIIGATIIAFSLVCIVNGLRSGHLSHMVLGTISIAMQSFILYRPDYLNMDFGVIFIVSLICALCVAGLIAGSTAGPDLETRQRTS